MLPNNLQKKITKLQQKKYRREFGEFLVEGIKGVGEAMDSNMEIDRIIIEVKRKEESSFKKIMDLAQKKQIIVEFCAQSDIGKIKTTDTFSGVLAVVQQAKISLEELSNKKIICLDNIKDPGNLGTIIRTADWFGINEIILSEDCVDLYNPKVVRASMGSIFKTNIFQSKSLFNDLNVLRNKDYQLAGLTMNGEDLDKIGQKNKIVYILGSESHGISKEVENMLDKRYTIKGGGQAESLNVAIAAGILLSKVTLFDRAV